MSRDPAEIQAELGREREELGKSVSVLEAELNCGLDVREQVRSHPLAGAAVGAAVVALVALIVAALVSSAAAVVRWVRAVAQR